MRKPAEAGSLVWSLAKNCRACLFPSRGLIALAGMLSLLGLARRIIATARSRLIPLLRLLACLAARRIVLGCLLVRSLFVRLIHSEISYLADRALRSLSRCQLLS